MTIKAYKYVYLVMAQLLLLIAVPLSEHTLAARLGLNIAVTVIFAAAIFSISHERRKVLFGLALMLPSFISLWFGLFDNGATPITIGLTGASLFFAYTAALIFIDVLGRRDVGVNIIAGGISVYLLLGLLCGFAYALAGLFDPQAFSLPGGAEHQGGQGLPNISQFIYFSFTTLTTLGYGDIAPVNSFVRIFASIEAIVGQIYLVVFIARLVGLHLTNPGR